MIPSPRRLIIAMGASLLLLALLWLLASHRPVVQAAPRSGPDLTAEIILEPATPGVGEEVTIRFIVRNQGSASTGGAFTVYLYINPPDRPPTPNTLGRPFGFAPLPAGGSAEAQRQGERFGASGCDNVIYVWVDRDGQVDDIDRSNNLVALPFCVGVRCALDAFEGQHGDDLLGRANWISLGETQERTFCRTTVAGLDPRGDQDWVKLSAFAGMTYTLSTANAGIHAHPRITLWSGSGEAILQGPAPEVIWQPPASGLYYAQIRNSDAKEGSGPLTRYDLNLSAIAGVSDDFEPDDTCSQAREIPTDGSRQTRLFQTPGDVDWVKFTVAGGESFAIVADNTTQGVNPIINLYNSCQQFRSLERVAQGAQRVEGRSAEGSQTYYVHVSNQNPARFGADARYDLSVRAAACAADAFEEDDTFNQAKPLAVGETQTNRNFCPAGDEDWVRFDLEAGQIYVLKTANLGFAADTVLELFDGEGALIAMNDDYDYVKASRIIYEPPRSGVYYARVRHHNPAAAGPDTRYDLTLQTGFCTPDAADSEGGDNGPGDARTLPADGSALERNFCATPLARDVGDQDWFQFEAEAGGRYQIETSDLAENTDTVLALFDRNGMTVLQTNDDAGAGLNAGITFTPTVSGVYFVRATQFNSRVVGRQTGYNISMTVNPPLPTPTPTPTAPPLPTPTPPPAAQASELRTLILVNQERMAAVHGSGPAAAVLAKLMELADHAMVQGAVVQVETGPGVAAAYAAWTAGAATMEDTHLANQVAAAIRSNVLTFTAAAPKLKYVVIVGDDRIIPYYRVSEGLLLRNENEYVSDLSPGSTIAAALAEDMILTDDFYTDLEPSQWQGNELYIPDFASGRLIQEPDEIMGQIDIFLEDAVIDTRHALVTGYDFVQDSATVIRNLLLNDAIANVSPADFIGPFWPGDALRGMMLTSAAADTRFDLISINGHATHTALGVPDERDIQASEIMTATNAFVRALVYNMGCHGGLNDPALLDLPQAFVQRGAIYVANTGFGWGGGGVVYTEALMRNFTREILTGTQAEVGPALAAAKKSYVSRARVFGPYDAKILMQMTLYGLPMFHITSGGTLSDEDPFPSVSETVNPPTSFGQVSEGSFAYGLPASFAAFGPSETNPEYKESLDGNVVFASGAPVQPAYYRDLSAPLAGSLRGVLFLGGVYTDTQTTAPIALAHNEYITDTTPPDFSAAGWHPGLPFSVQSSALDPSLQDTIALALGQYNPTTGTQRVFENMSFGTYYSDSPDRSPPDVYHIDAVLDAGSGQGLFKVKTTDSSGIQRVVVAYTAGEGVWHSQDLTFDAVSFNWTGAITATPETRYFIQVVDAAGNVTADDNKGEYYPLLPALPLAAGRAGPQSIFLPAIQKGG